MSFKTRSPDGLLLCAFSPGDQEEFLAVQLKNGRPYFLFDPQVFYFKQVMYVLEVEKNQILFGKV